MPNYDQFDRFEGDRGVWVIYGYDLNPYPKSIHRTAQEAVIELSSGYNIAFWEVGKEFRDAIREWEARRENAERT